MWPRERGQQRLAGGVSCSMREDRGSQARLWEIIIYLLSYVIRAVMFMRLNGVAKNFVG